MNCEGRPIGRYCIVDLKRAQSSAQPAQVSVRYRNETPRAAARGQWEAGTGYNNSAETLRLSERLEQRLNMLATRTGF